MFLAHEGDRIREAGAACAQQTGDHRRRQARTRHFRSQLFHPGRRRVLRRKLVVVQHRRLVNTEGQQEHRRDDAGPVLARGAMDHGREPIFLSKRRQNRANVGRTIEQDFAVPIPKVALAIGQGVRGARALTTHERDMQDA